jgi:hypothetical protein
MKTLFTFILCASMTAAFAQSRTAPAPAATTPASTTATQAPTLSAKQKTLCKEWKFTGSESYDLAQPPTATQKNDLVMLMESGRYRLILDGVAEGGTWTVDAACKWITMTSDAGVVKKFQILAQTDTSLKVDYRDEDGTHNVFIYAPAGAAPAPTKK